MTDNYVGPIAGEWRRMEEALADKPNLQGLQRMLRLVFLLGAHRTVKLIVRSTTPSIAIVLMSSEMREFEREVHGHQEAA